MSRLTSDPTDPELGYGEDAGPVPQNAAYLVLSEEERAKGFIRPVRASYRHVGRPAPSGPIRDLTPDEVARYGEDCAKIETKVWNEAGEPAGWQLWTQADLDAVGKGCGTITTMCLELAETYARDFTFYSHTYCVGCCMHLPVGPNGEFVWVPDGSRVGT